MKCQDCGYTQADHPAPPRESEWRHMWDRDSLIRSGPCALRLLMHERLISRLDPAQIDDDGRTNRCRVERRP